MSPHQTKRPPLPPEPTEEQLRVADLVYNEFKNSPAKDAHDSLVALRLDLQHGGAQ